ncbi:hypothetical protein Rgna01_30820 [Mediterraneibacter gnavus]|nr:hypothetical protein [Mediterraneibacter gnavus]GLU96918.1 hypothetical protein Rgna01_30820 [Mediterraneibacter gnavus]
MELQISAVVCASGDKFIAEPEQKIRVHEMFGADIYDLSES